MPGTIKTVTEQIYQEIRNEILTQSLRAGEKITIKMLHDRYGVSSSPIREALVRLQQDGLIEYKPNVGMRVVQLTVNDLKERFPLMAELDAISLRFAASSDRADRLVEELTEIQQQTEAAFYDEANWDRLSDEFHLKFYEIAGNSRLSSAAKRFRTQFTIFTNIYQKDEKNRRSILAEHQAVLDALKEGNIAEAEVRMRNHGYSAERMAMEAFNEQAREQQGESCPNNSTQG